MATYYVDGAVGDDGNLGTSEGVGNAWETIQHAIDTVAAGDKVYIKASATYAEALSKTGSALGASGAWTVFEGYTTTPGDGGQVTNDAAGGLAQGLSLFNGSNFAVFKNITNKAFTGNCFGTAVEDHVVFIKCRGDTPGTGSGFNVRSHCRFLGCMANNVTNATALTGANFTTVLYCTVRDVTGGSGTGIGCSGTDGVVIGCLVFNCARNCIDIIGAGRHICLGNTIDGNNDDSDRCIRFFAATEHHIVCMNNIVYDGAIGIVGNDAEADEEQVLSYNNLVNANTTKYTNFTTFGVEVDAAPAFVDEAGADYTPDTDSPVLHEAYDVTVPGWVTLTGDQNSIGAVQPVSGGGGGGGGGSGGGFYPWDI